MFYDAFNIETIYAKLLSYGWDLSSSADLAISS
jgi:hypothetical protein